MYNGTSLIRSPTGLGKSDLNGEVAVNQGAIHSYCLGPSKGEYNGEVT